MSDRYEGVSALARNILAHVPPEYDNGLMVPVDVDELVAWAKRIDEVYKCWEETIDDFDDTVDALDEAEKLIEKLQKGEGDA